MSVARDETGMISIDMTADEIDLDRYMTPAADAEVSVAQLAAALVPGVESRALAANVLFAVAGGLALVAGLEAIFTDWSPEDGGDEDGSRPEPSVKLRAAPGGLAVQW